MVCLWLKFWGFTLQESDSLLRTGDGILNFLPLLLLLSQFLANFWPWDKTNRRKWKSWPAGGGDPWPWHKSSGGCPLCRFETTCQLLHPAAGSNQVGCSCTWQRSLFRETNTGATEEITAVNQSWRSCNHLTSNRPYKVHQVPYLVPRTADCLSPLWSNTNHWPYAPGVCSVTGMLWWILHSWLIEYPVRDNSRDLHCGIPARSGILLSDMTQLTSTSPQTWTI